MTSETTRQPSDTCIVTPPLVHAGPSPGYDVLPPVSGAGDPAVYGSFWLGNTEFALRAGAIKEVVNAPAAVSAVPLSPPFMLGLFNLRGRIIPIVELRLLLEVPDSDAPDRKVAIIEDGPLCIGLMVDRTGEVLNTKGVARVDFGPKRGQPKDVVVEGLLKLDGGRRIVQILDPFEILNLEKVPQGEILAGRGAEVAAASRGPRLNCISFQFGHTTCAIDLRHVTEVMDAPEIMESVLVHDCFVGITNVRGKTIPVADFRNFMRDTARLRDSKSLPPKRKMLIVETEGGAIGLLVYSIDSIVSCFADEILQFTKLALPRGDIVRGCLLGNDNSIIMLLDHDALKRDPLLVDTARRCNEIHPVEDPAKARSKTQLASTRLTFIVFTVDMRLALNTSDVSEVIDYPTTLLQPPFAIDFVDGVVNLRGELISLIDPRKLYGMPVADHRGGRVLIFKQDGHKYGLVVDSVDEIVNTTENQVGEMPSLSHHSKSKKVADDICGCIKPVPEVTIMILDVDAVLRRCFNLVGEDRISSSVAD